jgi:cytochrome c oxidase subunit 1
MAKPR